MAPRDHIRLRVRTTAEQLETDRAQLGAIWIRLTRTREVIEEATARYKASRELLDGEPAAPRALIEGEPAPPPPPRRSSDFSGENA